jgi:hypothetical protein
VGARGFADDASTLLLLFALAKLGSWRWDGRDWIKKAPKGGRGAGPGATSQPVPQGATTVWSEETMRLFVQQMRIFGIDPAVVLLGIAAASNFNADENLGGYTGLLMVARDDLAALGYPGVPLFEELDAPRQIPWIGRVIGYRIASSGGSAPKNVPELAALLHPSSNPNVASAIRNEAQRRAAAAEGTMLYISHANLLRHVLANP